MVFEYVCLVCLIIEAYIHRCSSFDLFRGMFHCSILFCHLKTMYCTSIRIFSQSNVNLDGSSKPDIHLSNDNFALMHQQQYLHNTRISILLYIQSHCLVVFHCGNTLWCNFKSSKRKDGICLRSSPILGIYTNKENRTQNEKTKYQLKQ